MGLHANTQLAPGRRHKYINLLDKASPLGSRQDWLQQSKCSAGWSGRWTGCPWLCHLVHLPAPVSAHLQELDGLELSEWMESDSIKAWAAPFKLQQPLLSASKSHGEGERQGTSERRRKIRNKEVFFSSFFFKGAKLDCSGMVGWHLSTEGWAAVQHCDLCPSCLSIWGDSVNRNNPFSQLC